MKKIIVSGILLLSTVHLFSQVSRDTTPRSNFTSILEVTQSVIIDHLNLQKTAPINFKSVIHVAAPSMAHTAFFCKIEDKLIRSSNFPVKMRLGDINYTNMLEGKNVHEPHTNRSLQLQN